MPKKSPSPTPPAPTSPPPAAATGAMQDLHQVTLARELFWHNVMREILTSLSVLATPPGEKPQECLQGDQTLAAPGGAGAVGGGGPGPDLFNGRLAILTKGGERIPIAEVFPLLACGVAGTSNEKALSIAVECSVFQIRTPGGEVYTLPLHEMRGFHALSEELMWRLEEASRRQPIDDTDASEPFGFAAFTSLAKTKLIPDQPDAAI